jgi:hypothetical protein
LSDRLLDWAVQLAVAEETARQKAGSVNVEVAPVKQKEEKLEGVVEPIEPITVSSEVRRVIPPIKPWFCVEVANDGPDDVYVLVNPEKSFDWHQVLNGETYKVDMKRPVITEVELKCESDKTASVRLVGVR